jgi:hypothetical protein
VNIKLETQRGALIHSAELALEGEPPDVLIWGARAFRFVRTDGVWDQKKHVYREGTVCSLNKAGDAAAAGELAAQQMEAFTRATTENAVLAELDGARQVTLNLTAKQSDLLTRARVKGGFTNYKATLLAGLEAIDKAGPLTNDALLALLAKRLRGAPQITQN